MATRRYKIEVGEAPHQVVEEIGGAVNSDTIELTVDIANTRVNAASGTRTVTKEEVLNGLEKIKMHITKSNWPPA